MGTEGDAYFTSVGQVQNDVTDTTDIHYESLHVLPHHTHINACTEDLTFKLIGITKGGHSIHSFIIKFHLTSGRVSPTGRLMRSIKRSRAIKMRSVFEFTSNHVYTQRFGVTEVVTSISPLNCCSAEFRSISSLPSLAYHTLTGHMDGTVRLWQFAYNGVDPQWRCVGTINAHTSPVTAIVSANFSRFASVSSIDIRLPTRMTTTTIKIWEMDSSPPLFQVDGVITLKNLWESDGSKSDFLAKHTSERETLRRIEEQNNIRQSCNDDRKVFLDWVHLPNGSLALIVAYCNLALQTSSKSGIPKQNWDFTFFLQQSVNDKESRGASSWRPLPHSIAFHEKVLCMSWITQHFMLAIGTRSGITFITTWDLMCMLSACMATPTVGNPNVAGNQTTQNTITHKMEIIETPKEIIESNRCVDWAIVSSLRSRNTCGVRMATQDFSQYTNGLPTYHPKILIEYMMAGRFDVVGSVLQYLVRVCRRAFNLGMKSLPIGDVPLSIIMQHVVPDLEKLHTAQSQQTEASATTTNATFGAGSSGRYGFLSRAAPPQTQKFSFSFRSVPVESPPTESSSAPPNDSSQSDQPTQSTTSHTTTPSPHTLTSEDARDLEHFLSQMELMSISPKEQVHLLSIVDTFIYMQEKKDALDECGIRFLVKYKLYNFMRRSAMTDDAPSSLTSADFCWAYHSESQQVLIEACLPSDCDWPTARALGTGYWLRSRAALQDLCGRFAKVHFMKDRDPNDCLFWYIILSKKGVLVDLFRTCKQDRFAEFFKQDFTQERWRVAASKNAYALMSKRRYDLAAAYFVLSGSIEDAVSVCIKNMNDPQLALIVCRIVEGDNSRLTQSTLRDTLLRIAMGELTETGELPGDGVVLQKDIWLASIFYWSLNEQKKALFILLPSSYDDGKSGKVTKLGIEGIDNKANRDMNTPIHFVRYLRTHSVVRQVDIDQTLEAALHRNSAYTFASAGAFQLAYEQILFLKEKVSQQKKKDTTTTATTPTPVATPTPAPTTFAPRAGFSAFGRSTRPSFMSSFNAPPSEDEKEKERDKALKQLVVEIVDKLFMQNLILRITTTQVLNDECATWVSTLNETQNVVNEMEEEKSVSTLIENCISPVACCSHYSRELHFTLEFLKKKSSLPVKAIIDPLRHWAKMCCYHGHLIAIKHIAPIAIQPNLSHSKILSVFLIALYKKLRDLFSFLRHTLCAEVLPRPTQVLTLVDSALELWICFESFHNISSDVISNCKHDLPLGSITGVLLLSYFISWWTVKPLVPPIPLIDEVNYDCYGSEHRLGENCSGLFHFLRMFDDITLTITALTPIITHLRVIQKSSLQYEDLFAPPAKTVKSPSLLRQTLMNPSLGQFLLSFFRYCELKKFVRTMEHIMLAIALHCAGRCAEPLLQSDDVVTTEDESTELNGFSIIPRQTSTSTSTPTPTPTSTPTPSTTNSNDVSISQQTTDSGGDSVSPTKTSEVAKAEPSVAPANSPGNDEEHWAQIRTWILSQEWMHVFNKWLQNERSAVGEMAGRVLVDPNTYGLSSEFPLGLKTDITTTLMSTIHNTPLQPILEATYSIENRVSVWDSLSQSFSSRSAQKRGNKNDIQQPKNALEEGANETLNLKMYVHNWNRHNNYKIALETPSDSSTIYQDKNFIQSCVAAPGKSYLVVATSECIREFVWKSPPSAHTGRYHSPQHRLTVSEEYSTLNLSSISLIDDGAPVLVPIHARPRGKVRTPPQNANGLTRSMSKAGYSPYPFLDDKRIHSSSNNVRILFPHHDKPITVWHLESHPYLPCYVSAGEKGRVLVWEYGQPKAIARYGAPRESLTRINRVHFNRSGTKMGACDLDGFLSLWNFSSGAPLVSNSVIPQKQIPPYLSTQCYTKSCYDFCFLNEGSVVATAGCNSGKGYFPGNQRPLSFRPTPLGGVGIWDFLLPPNGNLVASLPYPQDERGASAILYSPRHQMLIVGGKKGEICCFDLRTYQLLQRIETHENTVKSLSMHPSERMFVSGSSDGNIKVFLIIIFFLLLLILSLFSYSFSSLLFSSLLFSSLLFSSLLFSSLLFISSLPSPSHLFSRHLPF
jgi:hypothetical protein